MQQGAGLCATRVLARPRSHCCELRFLARCATARSRGPCLHKSCFRQHVLLFGYSWLCAHQRQSCVYAEVIACAVVFLAQVACAVRRSHPDVSDLHIALNPYQREACGIADDGYLCFDAFDADKVRVLPELRLKMGLLRAEQSVCDFYSKDVARDVRHKFQDHVRSLCVFVFHNCLQIFTCPQQIPARVEGHQVLLTVLPRDERDRFETPGKLAAAPHWTNLVIEPDRDNPKLAWHYGELDEYFGMFD